MSASAAKDVYKRQGQAAIDVAGVCQTKAVCCVLAVAEHIGLSLIHIFRVPMLMFSPPQIVVMSSTSAASSAMMGEAPQASTMLAQSFTVT